MDILQSSTKLTFFLLLVRFLCDLSFYVGVTVGLKYNNVKGEVNFGEFKLKAE